MTATTSRRDTPPGPAAARKIVINPVTRIEGHAKVTITLDDRGQVERARFHVIEFRGFERFARGRPYWEMPQIVQRLCGICPVSHHLCAAKATDILSGVDQLSPTAEKLRRLMHYGQVYQSHALHFFHLASPDLLLGFDAPPATRNVVGLAGENPELVVKAIRMRRWGQQVIAATGGKRIHPTSAVPGGIHKHLSRQDRDTLAAEADTMVDWALQGLGLFKELYRREAELLEPFGSYESNFVSLVRPDGGLDLYDGRLRAKAPDGSLIFDQVAPQDYLDVIREEVRSYSYMKFPFIRSLGREKGWYRVGPLARLNCCEFIDTPQAEQERQEFVAHGRGRPVHSNMAYHWARLIETVHAGEKIRELLDDPELLQGELLRKGTRRSEAVALLEAPRGTLFHHYRIDDQDKVQLANLIVSTTSNNEAMNQAVRRVAEDYLAGKALDEITEGMLNRVEVAIRAFDPCLSCATHALGQMALELSVEGPDGEQLKRLTR